MFHIDMGKGSKLRLGMITRGEEQNGMGIDMGAAREKRAPSETLPG